MEEDAYYVIARSGFGDLFLWGEKNGHKYIVDSCHGWILQKDSMRDKIATKGADAAIQTLFAVLNRKRCDLETPDKQRLFDLALKKFEPLATDEVFAFEPAPVAGGTTTLQSIAKRNIHVYLSLLTQFGHREILDREGLIKTPLDNGLATSTTSI